MPGLGDTIGWYDQHAGTLAGSYEALAAERLLGWLVDLVPSAPSLVLDVGAGSGRDAAWLARLGHDVVAVEPSPGMRAEAVRRHPDVGVRWISDSLPGLTATLRLGLAFDLILLSAVWQHVPPTERARALRKLFSLLRPCGILAITLRQGPTEAERGTHPVSLAELQRLASEHGGMVVRASPASDQLGRGDVSWTGVALRLPDDGTGALPLLRHVILNDDKSSTYKLGLLRALCRIADGAAGTARDDGDEHVALPLGLVALYWLRLYLPLLRGDLPQSPSNARSGDRLGFVRGGFQRLMADAASPLDLRVGMLLGEEAVKAVHPALRDAAQTITRMPATYLTYPGGGQVLPVVRTRSAVPPAAMTLDAATLWSFGAMRVPRDLWRAMQRYAAWIEPALIAEWARLMHSYAASQGRLIDAGHVAAAMVWADPIRDVSGPRQLAIRMFDAGRAVHCVWSGRLLNAGTLDIDHCLPWSAWPCSDLWNLLPAHRRVNQHLKRDRLPSDEILRRAREPILAWWDTAYLAPAEPLLPRRFVTEACASLPALQGKPPNVYPDDVFAAVTLQRLRLRQDQQVPEWGG